MACMCMMCGAGRKHYTYVSGKALQRVANERHVCWLWQTKLSSSSSSNTTKTKQQQQQQH